MTDKLKCPICGKDLIEIEFGKRWFLACDNSKCRCKGVASYVVWEHIDRTRKALGVAKEALNDIQFTDDGNQIVDIRSFARHAFDQIKTALEQKEQE